MVVAVLSSTPALRPDGSFPRSGTNGYLSTWGAVLAGVSPRTVLPQHRPDTA